MTSHEGPGTTPTHTGYAIDKAAVHHAIETQLDPEIQRLTSITDGMQHTGPIAYTFRDSGNTIPVETTPLSSGQLMFGNPDTIVYPESNVFFHDEKGEHYRTSLSDVNTLFDQKMKAVLKNQEQFLTTLHEFRRRLLETVGDYQQAERDASARFDRIANGIREG